MRITYKLIIKTKQMLKLIDWRGDVYTQEEREFLSQPEIEAVRQAIVESWATPYSTLKDTKELAMKYWAETLREEKEQSRGFMFEYDE